MTTFKKFNYQWAFVRLAYRYFSYSRSFTLNSTCIYQFIAIFHQDFGLLNLPIICFIQFFSLSETKTFREPASASKFQVAVHPT